MQFSNARSSPPVCIRVHPPTYTCLHARVFLQHGSRILLPQSALYAEPMLSFSLSLSLSLSCFRSLFYCIFARHVEKAVSRYQQIPEYECFVRVVGSHHGVIAILQSRDNSGHLASIKMADRIKHRRSRRKKRDSQKDPLFHVRSFSLSPKNLAGLPKIQTLD